MKFILSKQDIDKIVMESVTNRFTPVIPLGHEMSITRDSYLNQIEVAFVPAAEKEDAAG
jgi:hypothetical protein